MAVSIELDGLRKTGKSTFGYSAPPKIVIFDFDLGLDRVAPKFKPSADSVVVLNYGALSLLNKRKQQESFIIKEWERLLKEYNDALENPEIKTIMFDTFTGVWELRRLSYLAELNVEAKQRGEPLRKNLMPQEYFIPNTDMKTLLTQAKIHDKNLVLIHHLKEVYREGRPTGEMEADGFKYTGDLVDIVLMSGKRNGKPFVTIKDCGLALNAEGLEIEDPTFEKVVTLVNKLRDL